ncbi:MAG: fasciclin domain-containing protein [Bacteroidales bacterium]|nr:fasciclin domain-containing protein [Bacteroidales bacterium]
MGSNGIFYLVDKVQATNGFETVLGDILLSPEYTLMYQAMSNVALELEGLLKNPSLNVVLFLIGNDQFKEAGFNYNAASGSWEFLEGTTRPDLGNNVNEALQRFVNLHIILVSKAMLEKGFDIANSTGVVLTYGEEYIKYSNGSVYASGNPTSKRPAINKVVNSGAVNGQSYGISSPILFSVGHIGSLLRISSFTNPNNRASKLIAYLEKAANATYVTDDGVTTAISGAAYNVLEKSIKDVKNTELVTMFLPNDPAMDAAVSDGILLPIASFAPNGDPNTIGAHNQIIEQFAKYHIIRGNVPVGENAGGNYSTYLKKEDGTFATITVNAVEGDPGSITVTDWKGRTANVIITSTNTYNILGNRCIVHLVDNYLDYRVDE